jgi:hypothetical protein
VLRFFGALTQPDNDLTPFNLTAALRAAGFTAIETVEATCPLGFRDEDEWWKWS